MNKQDRDELRRRWAVVSPADDDDMIEQGRIAQTMLDDVRKGQFAELKNLMPGDQHD